MSSPMAALRKAARKLWRERRWYGRRRDWLARWYNGLINRMPWLPWPGRNGIWPVYLAGVAVPFFVRQGSKDWVALREVWHEGEYEMVLAAQLEGVATVVDLGSNIGTTLRLWLHHFPAVRVVGVEPDPDNLELCRRCIAALGATERVVLVGAAVAADEGRVFLDRSSGNALVYHTSRQPIVACGLEVDARRVDQILDATIEGLAVDLLKCDVEGAEAEVFADCSRWIRRVRHLVIEIHPDYSRDQLLEDLRVGGVSPEVMSHRAKPSGVELVLLRLIPSELPCT